jgi:hypothetical protein
LRNFILIRHLDISGISGTGIVAEGVQFSDGRVCMCWLTKQIHSLVIHANMAEIENIHGHQGATTIHWLDEDEI